jgi:hypothetical protein
MVIAYAKYLAKRVMFVTKSLQYNQVLLHSSINFAWVTSLVEAEIRVCSHTHENWQILICPHSDLCQWEFRCLPPDGNEPLTDGQTYCCKDDALSAAKTFVEKHKIWSEISAPLDEWIDQGRITVNEKNAVLAPVIKLLKRFG